jgi:hypothetical protein
LEITLSHEDQDYDQPFKALGMQEGDCSNNGYSSDYSESAVNAPFVSSTLALKRMKRSAWEAAKFHSEAFVTFLFGGAVRSQPHPVAQPGNIGHAKLAMRGDIPQMSLEDFHPSGKTVGKPKESLRKTWHSMRGDIPQKNLEDFHPSGENCCTQIPEGYDVAAYLPPWPLASSSYFFDGLSRMLCAAIPRYCCTPHSSGMDIAECLAGWEDQAWLGQDGDFSDVLNLPNPDGEPLQWNWL